MKYNKKVLIISLTGSLAILLVLFFLMFSFYKDYKKSMEDSTTAPTAAAETTTGPAETSTSEKEEENEQKSAQDQEEAEGEEYSLPMDCLLQYPELPTGCESVALTTVLNYYGFNLDKFFIVDNYLLFQSDDYEVGFGGDPYSEDGSSIYPKGIVDTANNFLNDYAPYLCAYEISGTSFDELLDYVKNGVPVLIWITDTYDYPEYSDSVFSYEGYTYYDYWAEHCVVLSGYDTNDGTVQIQNPQEGEMWMDKSWMEFIYDACGRLAVVIC